MSFKQQLKGSSNRRHLQFQGEGKEKKKKEKDEGCN